MVGTHPRRGFDDYPKKRRRTHRRCDRYLLDLSGQVVSRRYSPQMLTFVGTPHETQEGKKYEKPKTLCGMEF